MAGRAPGRTHRAGAAPPRPAGRRAHRAAGRRSACASACSTSSPRPASPTSSATSGPTCSAPTGMPRSRRRGVTASAGFVGDALLDQRVLARRGHLLGQRDPLPRADPALDPGGRARPRAGARPPRAAAPAHGRRAPHRLAGQHRHPAGGRGGLRPRALGAAVPAVRRHGAGGDDRRGAAPAHDVLVPDVPGRAGAHRRRQAAATAGQRSAAAPRPRRPRRCRTSRARRAATPARRGSRPARRARGPARAPRTGSGPGRCTPRRAARRRPPWCRARAR